MFRAMRSVTAAVAVAALGCAAFAAEPVRLPKGGKVVAVYDGDTITVEADGKRHKCRLLGIDAPEMSYGRLRGELEKLARLATLDDRKRLHPAMVALFTWTRRMEQQAKVARDELAKLVKDKAVTLGYDSTEGPRDRYKRLLVYVGVGGVDVNGEIVRRGLAVAERRFQADRLKAYIGLEREARKAKQGMWAEPGDSDK